MTAFEYLQILAAVILGLAISDLAISTQKLFAAGTRVRWDWLAPLAAILAFVRIVTQWWSWYGDAPIVSHLTFGMYLAVLVSAVLLFLMSAAALPDDTEDPEIDLRKSYAAISRRYWLLFGIQWLLMNGISSWMAWRLGEHMQFGSPLFLIPVAAVALAWLPARGIQAAGLLGFLALYVWVYFSQTLG